MRRSRRDDVGTMKDLLIKNNKAASPRDEVWRLLVSGHPLART